MAFTPDFSLDYQHWTGTEEVTVLMKRNAGNVSKASVTGKRRPVDVVRSAFAGVNLRGDEVIWSIPDTLLGGGNDLEPDDTITDASSNEYHISQCSLQRFGSEWVCITRKGRS